jgi:hypothetical protein
MVLGVTPRASASASITSARSALVLARTSASLIDK